jgi:hypothetical protein
MIFDPAEEAIKIPGLYRLRKKAATQRFRRRFEMARLQPCRWKGNFGFGLYRLRKNSARVSFVTRARL